MLKKYFNRITTFLVITFAGLSSFSGFTVMPVKIEINKNNKIATMTLQNDDLVEKSFQLKVLKREYKDGKEEYVETKDLIAVPIKFEVKAGKMRLIRIAVDNKKNISSAENAYRLSIKELPNTLKVDNNITSTVNFIIEFNIPITVSS